VRDLDHFSSLSGEAQVDAGEVSLLSGVLPGVH